MRAESSVRLLRRLDDHIDDDSPRVWVIDLDDPAGLALPIVPDLRNGVGASPHDQAVVRRRRMAMSKYLTLNLLAQLAGVAATELHLTTDDHGRPAVDLDSSPANWRARALDFSVAHADNVFAIGVTFAGRIGVDVETFLPDDTLSSASSVVLTAAEANWIESLPTDERPSALLKAWTAKEALVKAVGLGASFGMGLVETAAREDGTLRIARLNESGQLAAGWNLDHHDVTVGASTAVIAVVTSRV